MQTYYFDMKDEVPVRDRVGLEFRTDSQAIEHGKQTRTPPVQPHTPGQER